MAPQTAGTPAPLELPSLLELIEEAAELSRSSTLEGDRTVAAALGDVVRAVEDVFSSGGFLQGGFICIDSEGVPEPSGAGLGHGLDVRSIETIYCSLLELFDTCPEVVKSLSRALLNLLDDLEAAASRGAADATWMRVALILLQSPLNLDSQFAEACLPRLLAAFATLQPAQHDTLTQWLQHYPADIFGARLVRPVQRFITNSISPQRRNARAGVDESVIAAAKLLSSLHQANEAAELVPHTEFYNSALSDSLNLKEEYIRWIQLREGDELELMSFCQRPFLLTSEAKSRILQRELFKEEYGMFVQDAESRTHWFNMNSRESDLEFQLVGVILGLAIYNNVLLDVHLPRAAWKKLLGLAPTLPDLVEALPALGKGLANPLAYEGDDVESVFCCNFQVDHTRRTGSVAPSTSCTAASTSRSRRPTASCTCSCTRSGCWSAPSRGTSARLRWASTWCAAARRSTCSASRSSSCWYAGSPTSTLRRLRSARSTTGATALRTPPS